MLNPSFGLTIKCRGRSNKGKNRIHEHGDIWKVIRVKNTVGFSNSPGPWALIQAQDDEIRWINWNNDPHFEIMWNKKEVLEYVVSTAIKIIDDPSLSWESKYDNVFNLNTILRRYGVVLDYYDPDTTYEEDTKAFVNALKEYLANLNT